MHASMRVHTTDYDCAYIHIHVDIHIHTHTHTHFCINMELTFQGILQSRNSEMTEYKKKTFFSQILVALLYCVINTLHFRGQIDTNETFFKDFFFNVDHFQNLY